MLLVIGVRWAKNRNDESKLGPKAQMEIARHCLLTVSLYLGTRSQFHRDCHHNHQSQVTDSEEVLENGPRGEDTILRWV